MGRWNRNRRVSRARLRMGRRGRRIFWRICMPGCIRMIPTCWAGSMQTRMRFGISRRWSGSLTSCGGWVGRFGGKTDRGCVLVGGADRRVGGCASLLCVMPTVPGSMMSSTPLEPVASATDLGYSECPCDGVDPGRICRGPRCRHGGQVPHSRASSDGPRPTRTGVPRLLRRGTVIPPRCGAGTYSDNAARSRLRRRDRDETRQRGRRRPGRVRVRQLPGRDGYHSARGNTVHSVPTRTGHHKGEH